MVCTPRDESLMKTHTLKLLGNQIGKAVVTWIDDEGYTVNIFKADEVQPFTSVWESVEDMVGARIFIQAPTGYTFRVYFNDVQLTDFTKSVGGDYVATLADEMVLDDGSWVVEFLPYNVRITSAEGGATQVDFASVSQDDSVYMTFVDESGLIDDVKIGTDVTFTVMPKTGYKLVRFVAAWERIIGEVSDGGEVVPLADGSYQFVLPASQIAEGINNIAVYFSKEEEPDITQYLIVTGEQVGVALVQLIDAEGGILNDFCADAYTTSIRCQENKKDVAAARIRVLDVPEGYTFRIYFNGTQLTDITESDGAYVAALEGADAATDGAWIVQFYDDTAKYDVNGDGSITIADVTSLVNIILGKK